MVAQFEIDRDGQARGEDEAQGWRARFSIDIEPLGPVHVHLSAQHRTEPARSHLTLVAREHKQPPLLRRERDVAQEAYVRQVRRFLSAASLATSPAPSVFTSYTLVMPLPRAG